MNKALIVASSMFALLSAVPALAQDAITIAVGSPGNPYWNAAGKMINAFDNVQMKPKSYAGAEDIIAAVSSGDDALGMIQADALAAAVKNGDYDDIKVVGAIGKEYALFVCGPNSGITDTDGLQRTNPVAKVIVGKTGNGFGISLDTWKAEDSKFGNFESVYESTSPDDGADADLMDNTVQCVALISALSGKTINDYNKFSMQNGNALHLAEADDWDLDDALTPKKADGTGGEDIYTVEEIPAETFPGLISSGSITTVSQPAYLIANRAWAEANNSLFRKLRSFASRNPNLVQ